MRWLLVRLSPDRPLGPRRGTGGCRPRAGHRRSRSIDDSEYDLEKKGYAAAFTESAGARGDQGRRDRRDRRDLYRIRQHVRSRNIVDWTVIRDEASARAFGDKLMTTPRSAYGRTAIGSGIELGIKSLAIIGLRSPTPGDRRMRRRHQQQRPRCRVRARHGGGCGDHDQRACHHQRSSGVLDFRTCPAARRPAELLPRERHGRESAASFSRCTTSRHSARR